MDARREHAVEAPLQLLHRCERYVAVDKPPGVAVHRNPWDDDDARPVLQRLRDQLRQRLYPIHRLDGAATGVLVFALDPEAARVAAEQFAAHTVDKRYHVIVRGWLDDGGEIDWPLAQRPGVAPVPARTAWRRLEQVELPRPCGRYATARYSLLEAQPHTGRLHQLRRHFAHLRHPVVGDVRYGDGAHNRLWRALQEPGLMLRAVALRFVGAGGSTIDVQAPAGLHESLRRVALRAA